MAAGKQGAAASAPPGNVMASGWEAAHSVNELRFFNPYAHVQVTENRLPHWQQDGVVYFLTFRLADAVPEHLLKQWQFERETWLSLHPQPWTDQFDREYHLRFSGKIEQWLDAGHGSCILRRADCASLVADALRHFDGNRHQLISFVVMPNHVHVLLVQNPEFPIKQIVQNSKSFTSHEINQVLNRSGILWQKDYFDRLIRDEQHFANCVRYIRRNPVKARLQQGEYVLYEGDMAKQIE